MTSGINGFTVQDLDIDQTSGPQLDEISLATFQATPYAYLLNLQSGGAGVDTAFPQVAYEASFLTLDVASGTSVDDLVFTHDDGTGTQVEFSTTVGFETSLQDVDGNTIYLFLDSNPASNGNVLIGRIADDPTAEAAFAIVLDEAANSLSAGAYIILYEAMAHLNPNDPNDVLDLTNQLFVSAATTTSLAFSDFSDVDPGNTDFATIAPDNAQPGDPNILVTGDAPRGGVNSPLQNSTVNVSTQGLGSGSQSVGVNAVLQIDFINGGVPNDTGTAEEIAYDSHVENVTEAEFSLTQVNPTNEAGVATRVDLTVSAHNDQNDTQGAAFRDEIGTNVDIERVQVFDAAGNLIEDSGDLANFNDPNVTATLNAQGDAVVTGLLLDYTVKVFSDGMDQIRIRNTDTNTNTSFDVGDIKFSTTTVGDDSEEVGAEINIFDDGPSIDQAIAGGTAAFETGATVTDTFTSDTGTDGGAGVVISQFQQTVGAFTGTLSPDGKSVLYEDANGTDFFRLVVTDNAYTFEVLQSQLNTTRDLDFNAIAAGGPKEIIDVPTTDGVDIVRFDGLIFTNNNPLDAANNPGPTNPDDDANPDALGFGIKQGQASQMNDNEGFVADLIQPTDGEFSQFSFDIQGIGNVRTVDVTYWTLDDGVLSGPTTTSVSLPTGNNTTTFTIGDNPGEIPGDGTAEQIFVKFDLARANQGVRVLNFKESQAVTFDPVTLPFTLSNTDADGDTVTSNQYSIVVDPAII